MDPYQLAAILTRAANLRQDIKRATVTVAPDDEDVLIVTADYHTPGRKIRIDARVSGIAMGRTCGKILAAWLGDEPLDSINDLAGGHVLAQQRIYLDSTPAGAIEYLREHFPRAAPTKGATQRAGVGAGAPASELAWSAPDH